jgi:cytoskeleton protein RodZ
MQRINVGHLMNEAVREELTTGAESNPAESTNVTSTTAGQQLALRRESLGWTIEQAAAQLNLAPRQIHALETDNFAALPGMATSRGFVRAYAKLMRIDSAPLLASISTEVIPVVETGPMRHTLSASFSESRLPTLGNSGATPKWWWLSAIVVLVGVVVLTLPSLSGAFMSAMKVLSPNVLGRTDTLANQQLPVPAAGKSWILGGVAPPNIPETPILGLNATGEAVAVDDGSVAASPVSPVVSSVMPVVTAPLAAIAVPVPVAVPATSAASNVGALVMHVRQESWIGIRDANDKVLFSRIVKAGVTETFDVVAPIAVTIGNAMAVDVTLRGEVVDIKSAAKSNVIKINLK